MNDLPTSSPECAQSGPNYKQYVAMYAFIRDYVQVEQGFLKKGSQVKVLVITSTNAGDEKPYVMEILPDGTGGYEYQIHVDRLLHEYTPLQAPEEGWPSWVKFY